MPTNTNTVTSMVPRTCANRLGVSAPVPPERLAANTSGLNAAATMTTNRMIGMILATVAMRLRLAASLTPRRIRKCTVHRMTEETATACTVLPSPKTGISAPSVDLMSTK